MKLRNLIFTLLALFTLTLNAQSPLGLVVSDFNSPYSFSINPALSRTNPGNRIYINWWGGSVSLNNNFLKYNAPFTLGKWINGDYPEEYVNSNGTLSFNQNWLTTDASIKDWKLNYLNEVYGPSIFFPIDDVGALGFGVKAVSGFNINGLNNEFGNILRNGLTGIKQNIGNTISQDEFSINTEKYQEWFLNFAAFDNQNSIHSWRWGATFKFLIGFGMAHLGSDNLNFTVNNAQNVSINQLNLRVLNTNNFNNTLASPFGLKFDFAQGAGLGTDLGLVYEYRPHADRSIGRNNYCERERNLDYKWKFGMSLTDIGFISYSGNRSDVQSLANPNYDINEDIIQNGQFTQDDAKLETLHNEIITNLDGASTNEFVSYSPMALNMQYDNNYMNNWHLGVYWTQNLKFKNSLGLRRASFISVTPRWQTERMELGMPVTLANDYTNLNFGIYGRLGPIIVGSDDVVGLSQYLSNTNVSKGSFYFAVRSKIGNCERKSRTRDYIVHHETYTDTVIERDTVIVKRKVTDTVIVNEKNKSNIALKADELKKKEAELKVKADELAKKEADLLNREKVLIPNNSTNPNCDKQLKDAQIAIAKGKEEQDLVKKQLENAKIELAANKKKCDDDKKLLNDNLATVKADLDKTKAKIALTTAENDNLKVQLARVNTSVEKVPCDKQLKALDSQLLVEKTKANINTGVADNLKKENELINAQLVKVKADCYETEKNNAKLLAEIETLKVSNLNGNKCCSTVTTQSDEIRRIQLNNELLSKELLSLKSKVSLLEMEKKNCQDLLNNSSTKAAALADCQKKNAEIAAKLKTTEAELAAVKLQKAKTDSELLALKSKPIEDCTPYKLKVTELEGKLGVNAKLLTDANIKIQTNNKTIEDLKVQNKLCEEKLKTAANIATAEDCTPYKLKVTELEAKIKAIEAKLVNAENNLVNANKLVADLTAQKKLCEEKLKTSSNIATAEDCTPIKLKNTELETKIKTAETELVNAKKTIAELTTQKKICEEKLKTNTNVTPVEDCAPLKEKIKSIESEIATLKTQNATISKEKLECEQKLKAKSEISTSVDCNTYIAKIAVLEKSNADILANLNKANAELKICNESKIGLEKQLSSLASAEQNLKKCDTDKSLLEAKIKSIEKELAEVEAKSANNSDLLVEIDKLKQSVEDKNRKIETLESDNKTCQKALASIKTELDDCNSTKNILNGDYESLKRQIIQMDSELASQGEQLKNKTLEIEKLTLEIGIIQGKLKECNDKLNPPKEEVK